MEAITGPERRLRYVQSKLAPAQQYPWNERVMAECYGPNAATLIHDADKTILKIVNDYSARMR